jgi:integrase/recombinase XerD
MNITAIFEYYLHFLQIEKGLSDNTLLAYKRDFQILLKYSQSNNISLLLIKKTELQDLLHTLYRMGIHSNTQARVFSSLRIFFNSL